MLGWGERTLPTVWKTKSRRWKFIRYKLDSIGSTICSLDFSHSAQSTQRLHARWTARVAHDIRYPKFQSKLHWRSWIFSQVLTERGRACALAAMLGNRLCVSMRQISPSASELSHVAFATYLPSISCRVPSLMNRCLVTVWIPFASRLKDSRVVFYVHEWPSTPSFVILTILTYKSTRFERYLQLPFVVHHQPRTCFHVICRIQTAFGP